MPPNLDPSADRRSSETDPGASFEAGPIPFADTLAEAPGAPVEPPDPFEEMVFAALDSLPEAFRRRLGSVAVVIEDEPSPGELASVRAQGLLGLYTGVPRTAYGATDAPVASKITIFRGPHLRQFRDQASLERGVAETVRHEVAHHFGISDARLEQLARERRSR